MLCIRKETYCEQGFHRDAVPGRRIDGTSLGLYEFASAGASLLACPLEEDVVAANHGDGVFVDVSADLSPLRDRDFSVKELSGMSWKCRMGKSPPEVTAQLLQRLPEECIMRVVEEFRTLTTAGATSEEKDKEYFLYQRDQLLGA